MQKLVTLRKAAEQLNISLAALRDWRFQGKHLDFVKVGRSVRITQSSIDRLIQQNTTRGDGCHE
jgi:excisionase family DNA binding protein